jgi:hypothetical protein
VNDGKLFQKRAGTVARDERPYFLRLSRDTVATAAKMTPAALSASTRMAARLMPMSYLPNPARQIAVNGAAARKANDR